LAAQQAAAATTPALPEGWTAASDPSSGRTYYVNLATQQTQWEAPVAHPGVVASTPAYAYSVQPTVAKPDVKKKLSMHAKSQWRAIIDYARTEASASMAAKNKKFFGLRKFAETAAKKKREASNISPMSAYANAAPGERPILALLEVDIPEIEKQNIEDFAENYFNLNRKGMFGQKTTVSKILSWKNEVIKTALLKMPSKELDTQATQCFRNITGFMGDRNSNKEDVGHAEKLLKTCLHAPEELRDEVYCQIIKQTSNNPSPESTLKGWMLLGVAAGAFAPSKEFEPFLLSYCESHREDGGGIGEYAKFAMGRLIKTSALGPRREVPTAIEIDAAKARLPALIRVYHLDGSYDTLPVTSWVTPAILKNMVAELRGIKDSEPFAIYEMTPEDEERYLEADERILDLVAYWQRLHEEEKSKGGEEGKAKKRATGNAFYRVVFKVHQYFEVAPTDKAAIHEKFIQAVYDVVSARYPAGEKDCLALAALQLQAEIGDDGISDLQNKLGHFLPAKLAEGSNASNLATQIRSLAGSHAGKSRVAAEAEYLAYVQEWQVYGSSFFFVEPQMNSDLPEEVFLAVNPKGILIINPDSKEVLSTYPYSEVPTWGHSGTSFVLHVGNLARQTKLYFATEQGKEINDIVRAYVNHLVAA
jgi:MyTH4 domain/WW domain/FERM central domain